MCPDTEFMPPPVSKELGEETFLVGDVEFPKWVLFGDEWIEFHESMLGIITDPWLCSECTELGYCKKEIHAVFGVAHIGLCKS